MKRVVENKDRPVPLKRPLPVALPSPTTRVDTQDGVEARPRGPAFSTLGQWPLKRFSCAPSFNEIRPKMEIFRAVDDRWYGFRKGSQLTRGQLDDQRVTLLMAVERLCNQGVVGPALLPELMKMGFRLPYKVCVLPMDIDDGAVLIGSSRRKSRLTLPTRFVRVGQTLAEAAADLLVDEVPEWPFARGNTAHARYCFRHLFSSDKQAVGVSFSPVLGCLIFCCRVLVGRGGERAKPASSKWSGEQLFWVPMGSLEQVLLGQVPATPETMHAPVGTSIAKGPSSALASLLRSQLYM